MGVSAHVTHTEQSLQCITSCFADASHLVLQMPRGCFALTSASGKLAFFTSLSSKKNTDHPSSPLVMSNQDEHNSLLTFAASSHLPGQHHLIYLGCIISFTWAASSHLPGLHHLIYLGCIISFTWAASSHLPGLHHLIYLCCIISSDGRIDKEIDNRLSKANSSNGGLNKCIWSNIILNHKMMIRFFRAMVLTTPLYSSKTLVAYRSHMRLLEHFHQHSLHTILNI